MKSERLSKATDIKASMGLIKTLLKDAHDDAEACLISARRTHRVSKIVIKIETELYKWKEIKQAIDEADGLCSEILEGVL